jgi:hypothetical protein
MANTQLRQKPKPLEITIGTDGKPVPNGSDARLSKSQRDGEPSTFFWHAEGDCCISVRGHALIPTPPAVLQLDAGKYSILYTLNPAVTDQLIKYAVQFGHPCPDRQVDNGESIIIDP